MISRIHQMIRSTLFQDRSFFNFSRIPPDEIMYKFGPFTNLVRTSLRHELKQHLIGQSLRHPLLQFECVDPRLYSRLNHLFEYRLRKGQGLNREFNDWNRLWPDLSSYDKLGWLLEQLLEERFGYPKGQDGYHQLIGQVWTDPELLTCNSDTLTCLFRFRLPTSPNFHFMVEDERNCFAELPDQLQVFRGHFSELEYGNCWTLNPNVAIDWACRSDTGIRTPPLSPENQFTTPIVTVGRVCKSQIVAYVNRRHEDEILVNPEFVRDRQSYQVCCDGIP